MHLGTKNKCDLFCSSLGCCYLCKRNQTNQNQITKYGWHLDMCKGELRPDRLDGWLYRSRHRCHFLGARVKEQERREGKRIKEYK